MHRLNGALQRALSVVAIRYVIAGGTSFAVNLALFWFCHIYWSMWYIYATILAGTCAWAVNFPLHKLWTFEDYRRKATTFQAPAHLSLKFANTYASDPLLLYLLVEGTGASPLFAKALVGALLGVQNYLLCRYLIFRRPA